LTLRLAVGLKGTNTKAQRIEFKENEKRVDLLGGIIPVEAKEGITFVWSESRATTAACYFLVLCLNLVIAPAVYAAAEN